MNHETAQVHPNIPFGGAISKDQFALLQRSLVRWWMGPIVWVPMLVYVFVFMGNDLNRLIARPSIALPDVLGVVLLLLLYWACTVVGKSFAWRRNQKFQPEIRGTVGEAGIEWNGSFTSTKLPWTKLVRAKEVPGMVLVFYSWNCAFYFPRHFFATEEHWTAFKSLLDARLRKS